MAEEEKKNVAVAAPTAVTTADEMKAQAADPNQFRQAFDARKQGYENNINSTLGNSLNSQRQGLTDAYNKNVTAQTQATNAGQQAFGNANTDLGTQSARTQNLMDSYADVRGLNRQPGSQQSLSLGLASSTAAGKLAQQQQMALQESQRQQELLKTNYQNQVAKAVAENDYRRAAALLDNFNNQNNWLEKNAAQMASFGNFTGYEQMYGPETANTMRQFWIGSNPELAYNTGAIDKDRYKAITGRDAPDVVPVWTGSGGGGGIDNWWGTVQGQMALGNSYSQAVENASGRGSGGGGNNSKSH